MFSSLLVAPTQAAAFDQFSEYCGNDVTQTPRFDGPEWDSTWYGHYPFNLSLKDPFYWGWLQWINEAKKWNGAPAFAGGQQVSMDFVSSASIGGAGAVTICGANPLAAVHGHGIMFNKNDVATLVTRSQARLQGFSAHEWGHRWGLGHSRTGDSWSGGPPTMLTCGTASQLDQRMNLSGDDRAAAAYLTENYSGYHSITANDSFENGVVHWFKGSGASLTGTSAGVDGSPKAGRIGTSGNRHIYNRTRVTDLQSVGGDGNVRGDRIKARVNYVDDYYTNTGHITIAITSRAVRYEDGIDLNCNFYDDDKNEVDIVGPWAASSAHCYPQSTWSFCDLPTSGGYYVAPDFPGWQPWDDPDAVDVQIGITNHVKSSSGGWTSVKIDRARIRWDF